MSSTGLLPPPSEAGSRGRVRTGGARGTPSWGAGPGVRSVSPVGAPSKPPGGRVAFSPGPTHHGPELLTLGLEAAGGGACRSHCQPAPNSPPTRRCVHPSSLALGPAPPLAPPCLPAPRSSRRPPCSRTSVPQASHGLWLGCSGSPNPSLPVGRVTHSHGARLGPENAQHRVSPPAVQPLRPPTALRAGTSQDRGLC